MTTCKIILAIICGAAVLGLIVGLIYVASVWATSYIKEERYEGGPLDFLLKYLNAHFHLFGEKCIDFRADCMYGSDYFLCILMFFFMPALDAAIICGCLYFWPAALAVLLGYGIMKVARAAYRLKKGLKEHVDNLKVHRGE